MLGRSLPNPLISQMQDIVLCKIYRKATSMKVLEQRAAMEEEMKNFGASPYSSPPSSIETTSIATQQEAHLIQSRPVQNMVFKKEIEEIVTAEDRKNGIPRESRVSPASLELPLGRDKLPELQVPNKFPMDWTQDPFWTQLNSPWLQSLTPYANILNF